MDDEIMTTQNEDEVIENEETEETSSELSGGAKAILFMAGAGVAGAVYGLVKLGRWGKDKLKARKSKKEKATEDSEDEEAYTESECDDE